MTETAETRTVVVERELAHPPSKVWRALTESSLMAEWLMKNSFQPVVGHEFTFNAPPAPGWDGVIESRVLEVEPETRISYSWGTLGIETVVTFRLTPAEDGTLLRMEHAGFGADREANYKGATYGWKRFIDNLERVVGGIE